MRFLLGLILLLSVGSLSAQRGKIIGGEAAPPESDFSWIVSFLRAGVPEARDAQFCAGTVIHPYWILSAAHCFQEEIAGSLEVGFGSADLDKQTRVPVAEIYLHPDYNFSTFDNDIALIRLQEPLPESVTVMPMIASTELQEPGTLATVLGWGSLNDEQPFQFPESRLQVTSFPIVSNVVANGENIHRGALTERMIAAGLAEGGKDTCRGDSGGPLVVPGPGGEGFRLAGITSFSPRGKQCADPEAYGAYASVLALRDWVNGIVRPTYLAWERENGSQGYFEDLDGDGLANYVEFSLGTDPQSANPLPSGEVVPQEGGGRPSFRFRRGETAGEATLQAEFSTNLREWVTVQEEDLSVEESGDGFETVKVQSPVTTPSGQGFYRLRPETARSLGERNRTLTVPSWVETSVFAGEDTQSFDLIDLAARVPVEVVVRSGTVDSRFTIVDKESGTLVLSANSDNAGGQDERGVFFPQEGRAYLLTVTGGSGESGSLFVGLRRELGNLAELSLGTSEEALSSSDQREDGRFIDEFLIPGVDFPRNLTIQTDSDPNDGGFDTVLSLRNAETGAVVAFSDDAQVTNEDGEVVTVSSSALTYDTRPRQDYIVQVSSFNAGDTGSYQLQSYSLQLVFGDQTIISQLDEGDELSSLGARVENYLLVTPPSGTAITARVTAESFEPFLAVLGGAEDLIGEPSDSGRTQTITLTADGETTYVLVISSQQAGRTGTYTLEVETQ